MGRPVVAVTHKIYTGDAGEADELALMFEDDGYAVRWARHRPGSFIELEVSDTPTPHGERTPILTGLRDLG